MIHFDPLYFVFVAPAFLLAMWAQFRLKSIYHQATQEPASLSGAAAARYILDQAGLHNVAVEPVDGFLSDHYEPRAKVLRLSPDIYSGHTMAAVGIAAHEAGHALQDAYRYAPLVIRNIAVPVANFGGSIGGALAAFGVGLGLSNLLLAGIVVFSGVVFFQLINLPVEFNASSRAKEQLVALNVVPPSEMRQVNRVLNAAALTYVAAPLQVVLTLAYYIFRYASANNRR
jgi:Zn-dependent membrane protease YugP